MINILIPIASDPKFFPASDYFYPKPLIDVDRRMMIEIVIESLRGIPGPKRFVFVIRKEDAEKHHLDGILNLLTDGECTVVVVDGHPQGAACSCLMAIDHIGNDDELLISNCDQLIDADLGAIIERFRARGLDAGTICFESVHPKWSFVRTSPDDGLVREAAEKRPISKDAVAGIYYYRRGREFVSGAMRTIAKDANVNGAYYISPVFNELVLDGHSVGVERIPASAFHSFYSPQKIQEYEAFLATRRNAQ